MKGIASAFMLFIGLFSGSVNASDEPTPESARKESPFVNSLGMKFIPVEITGGPTTGKRVLFNTILGPNTIPVADFVFSVVNFPKGAIEYLESDFRYNLTCMQNGPVGE